jgi:hypothetical protein
VGVIVTVGEPTVDNVCVISGEIVFVTRGVDTVVAVAGVKITCNVNAAAVWISLGGATCSTGVLQARIAVTKINAGKLSFNRRFIF